MKRFATAFILVSLLVSALPVAASGSQEAKTSAPVKLVLWAPKHFIPAQNEFFTDSALLAAARNGFEVEVQLFPWGEYSQKQTAAIEAKTLPDVCLGIDVPMHNAMGILRDVSDLFEEIGKSGAGWYDVNRRQVTIGGKQYGIPFHNEPQYVYYRSDLLAAAGYGAVPKNLDEFVDAARKMTNPDKKVWGFGNSFSNCPDGNNAFYMFMWAFGGSLQDKAGNITINSPETLKALNYYCDLYTKHKVMPPGVTGWDDTGNNKAFLAGQIAMMINSGSIIYSMRQNDPGWFKQTAVGPLPAGPAGPAGYTGGSVFGIFNTTKNVDKAKILIRGIMAADRYPKNLQMAGAMFFPVMPKYADDPFFTQDQWNKQVIAGLPHTKEAYFAGDPQPWVAEVSRNFMLSEMTSRVAVENWDPQKALGELEKRVIETKKKYEKR